MPTFPPRTAQEYQVHRDSLLARAVEALRSDQRVVAAWLSGSFGRGVDDAWSDFDLHVAVADVFYDEFWEQREQLYDRVGSPILIQPEMPSNAQHGGRFQLVIYPGPVEFDWNIGPYSIARRPLETRMLFARQEIPLDVPSSLSDDERREQAQSTIIFFWAMAPIAVKYAVRQQSRRASSQIDLLTGSFMHLWRLVQLADGPDPMAPAQNRATEEELDEVLPRLGAVITPDAALEVIRGLCAEVLALHPSLGEFGVSVPVAMPEALFGMIELARQELGRGWTPAHSVYR
ncbi:MAG: nucleotidyltransferase domain-containing protein [Thermomicrobiales bacterium]